jgi:hypothetical protein
METGFRLRSGPLQAMEAAERRQQREAQKRLRELERRANHNASFTMGAEAREYRETQALEKMTPEEREKYYIRRENGDDSGTD